MKSTDLGQFVAILASVGAIAGIVFLAFELRQNNALLEAQVSYSQMSVEVERRNALMRDPSLLGTFFKAQAGDPLTEMEAFRLELNTNNVLDVYRWQYREYRAGRLPDDYLDLRTWRDVWQFHPMLNDLFQEDRSRLEPDFVQFVDENVLNR